MSFICSSGNWGVQAGAEQTYTALTHWRKCKGKLEV